MMKGMVFAERYKLEDFVGQGGMSLVYRAVDIRTGHSVAVKILKSEYNSDKEFLERFQREAQAASLMSHHNLVNLLDVGVEGEYRYLVMEYVSGNTLKDIIRQKGRLNYQTAIQITIRILSALQHAHDSGIIHRDIKPQNVLIHSDGHVKVADFGIARMTGSATIGKGDTVVGSVHYSSPEQVSGSVVEATSDLYSTGVVLYEMLTGRVPFTGETPVAVAMQHIKDAPPPIADFAPETPPALVAVVMKALEKDPKKRFQSAREMADALMKAKTGRLDPASIAPESPPSHPDAAKAQISPVREISPQSRRAGQTTRHLPMRRRKKMTRLIGSVLMGAGVIWLLVFGVIGVINHVSRSAIAPDVVGLSTEEGEKLARRDGLSWQQTSIHHDSVPAGIILSQMPEADTSMQKGDSLLVTVSLGPLTGTTPNLYGLSYEEAAQRLQERNFGPIMAVKTPSSLPVGTVLAQKPEAGATFTPGQSIELSISGGSTMVPDTLGRTSEEAAALLADNSLIPGTPIYVETPDSSQVGTVLAQSPSSGTLAVLGAPVTLSIGVENQPYHGELALSIPVSDKERRLRVTLIINGEEKTEYEGTLSPSGSSAVIIPVSSTVSGELECRIYLDGESFDRQTVILN